MRKKIVISSEKRNRIMKDFKVSRMTVWSALSYKTNSSKARCIRAAALQRGGVDVECDAGIEVSPKTYWNEMPHQMVQVYSERVRIIVDLSSGDVVIEADEKVVERYKDMPVRDFYVAQAKAKEIDNDLK